MCLELRALLPAGLQPELIGISSGCFIHRWCWPSTTIFLCADETVMASLQHKHAKASPDAVTCFLVRLAEPWPWSDKAMEGVQDVHGQAVATLSGRPSNEWH